MWVPSAAPYIVGALAIVMGLHLLDVLHLPGGPGVRVDTHVYEDYFVPPHYDSLIAKLIVHDRSRPEAIRRMQRALDFFEVRGIHTSIPLHKEILQDPGFAGGDFSTRFMEGFLERRKKEREEAAAAAEAAP